MSITANRVRCKFREFTDMLLHSEMLDNVQASLNMIGKLTQGKLTMLETEEFQIT